MSSPVPAELEKIIPDRSALLNVPPRPLHAQHPQCITCLRFSPFFTVTTSNNSPSVQTSNIKQPLLYTYISLITSKISQTKIQNLYQSVLLLILGWCSLMPTSPFLTLADILTISPPQNTKYASSLGPLHMLILCLKNISFDTSMTCFLTSLTPPLTYHIFWETFFDYPI